MGSIDFYAVARSVLLVGRIEGQPNMRAVVQIKNNLSAFGHSKAFELTEEGFRWIGDYEISADEILGGIAPKACKHFLIIIYEFSHFIICLAKQNPFQADFWVNHMPYKSRLKRDEFPDNPSPSPHVSYLPPLPILIRFPQPLPY